jgi:CAAX protease family protein
MNIELTLNKESIRPEKGALSAGNIIILHLLPGMAAMALMLAISPLFRVIGILPSVPVIFVFVAPVLMIFQLGFLFFKGWQRNRKLSLQGIVLYREAHLVWWKVLLLALPLLVWIAFVWFFLKPGVNQYFIQHFFTWMPYNFFDEYFVNNLNQYPHQYLGILGVLFTISITLGGAVEELYFRGYLLPRMDHLGFWAPVTNIILFSLYHFWSPWENLIRIIGVSPWIFATWRTRNIYLSLLIHLIINAYSGIGVLLMLLHYS